MNGFANIGPDVTAERWASTAPDDGWAVGCAALVSWAGADSAAGFAGAVLAGALGNGFFAWAEASPADATISDTTTARLRSFETWLSTGVPLNSALERLLRLYGSTIGRPCCEGLLPPLESIRMRTVSFTLNGAPTRMTVDETRSLLWVLRDDLGLTGTKFGCGEVAVRRLHGARRRQGRSAPARLTMRDVEGKRVVTIEGLADATAGCTRCSRRSSNTRASSAATARPA